jgi:hypothetical protein
MIAHRSPRPRKFYGFGRKGQWWMYNESVGLLPFGGSFTLLRDDHLLKIDWYRHTFLTSGKAIMLPAFRTKRLIWIAT